MLRVMLVALVMTAFMSGCGGGGGDSKGSSSVAVTSSSVAVSSSSLAVSSSSKLSSSSVISSSLSSSSSSSKNSSTMVQSSSSVALSSSSSSAPTVVLTLGKDWFSVGPNGPSIAATGNGTNVTYSADWMQAGFWIAKEQAAIENHTVEIDFEASSEFKASGGNLYIYTIFDTPTAPFTDEKDCSWFMSANIVAGTPQTIRCTISTNGGFSQTAIPIHIRLVARVEENKPAPSGIVLITGGRILAP